MADQLVVRLLGLGRHEWVVGYLDVANFLRAGFLESAMFLLLASVAVVLLFVLVIWPAIWLVMPLVAALRAKYLR